MSISINSMTRRHLLRKHCVPGAEVQEVPGASRPPTQQGCRGRAALRGREAHLRGETTTTAKDR